MKKIILILSVITLLIQPSFAIEDSGANLKDSKQIAKLLNSQVKYANKGNFKKFIKTYDHSYISSDGFNLEIYSKLVKDIWNTYNNIKYDIDIKNIEIKGNNANVKVIESSSAEVFTSHVYEGELNSISESIYCLKKIDGKWKVISDKVIDETTSILYGDAKGMDVKLTVPLLIDPDTDYTAVLEFNPPEGTLAIASLAADKVEYPQKPTKEVFRTLPEDNTLERFFTSNKDNKNEYVVASIGLTRTAIDEENIKLSLTGFGYKIRRVNVKKAHLEGEDVKNK